MYGVSGGPDEEICKFACDFEPFFGVAGDKIIVAELGEARPRSRRRAPVSSGLVLAAWSRVVKTLSLDMERSSQAKHTSRKNFHGHNILHELYWANNEEDFSNQL